ncbi:MAG: hypothetical protein LBH59_04795 [Planctomycetaceae bacterium]|nr:hypothetical protein [Planctomycetaceae bacterium]
MNKRFAMLRLPCSFSFANFKTASAYLYKKYNPTLHSPSSCQQILI